MFSHTIKNSPPLVGCSFSLWSLIWGDDLRVMLRRAKLVGKSGFALPGADAAKPLFPQPHRLRPGFNAGTETVNAARRPEGITRRSSVQIRPPQPTMRTDLDIGAEKSETIMVSDFSIQFFCS